MLITQNPHWHGPLTDHTWQPSRREVGLLFSLRAAPSGVWHDLTLPLLVQQFNSCTEELSKLCEPAAQCVRRERIVCRLLFPKIW